MAALPWRLKYWNGSAWVDAELRRWDGAQWTVTNGYYWDGSAWTLLTDRTPPTATYTSTYGTAWHQSYAQGGSQRNDSDGNTYNYQGNSGSSPYGRQRSMWGFSTAIATDLIGSVAHYGARTYFTNVHTWYYAGGTARLNTHNLTSKPTTFFINRAGVGNVYFDQGTGQWVNWGSVVVDWAKAGTFYGFALYIESDDVQYYGRWSGTITHEQTYEK